MSKSKKPILITVGLCAVLIGVLALLQLTHTIHLFDSKTQKTPVQITPADNQKKQAVIEHGGNQVSSDTNGQNAANSTYTPPSNSANIVITPQQASSTQVTITTKLTGYSDGNCSLKITNGSATYTQTASVIYQPQFSTCAGFSVPVSSVGAGKWNIALSVTSGGITTNSSVTFEVK